MTAGTVSTHEPGPSPPGRNELGMITINTQVVAKLAARAAAEIPDAGAAAPRVLGQSMSGPRGIGARKTSLTGLPKTSADEDGSRAARPAGAWLAAVVMAGDIAANWYAHVAAPPG
jgi:hypothetical protein